MEKGSVLYEKYVSVLKQELLPAMGCTEPIAIAFAAAKARETLGAMPEKVHVSASGNLIKNVKSVVVPNTDGMKGIEVATAFGIVAGKSKKLLEVISDVSEQQKIEAKKFLDSGAITVGICDSQIVFDLVVTMSKGNESALVRIVDDHTNVVRLEKNGEVLIDKYVDESGGIEDENPMTVAGILDFAKTCDIEDVRPIIKRQIDYNVAISEEGLKNSWGANIGSTLLKAYGSNDVRIRAKAKAAAGSDARMNGCELPVVINSGSGNQGITVSIPVIEYAKELNSSEEELYRALILANLLGLHQKAGIGRLSAYCGAVSAGCAAGAAIAYLKHEGDSVIEHTLVNCLAITSGIICDGAKASCAAKIAESIDAAFLALAMAEGNEQFFGGDGIVKKGVENTIKSVAKLGKDGMRETDKEILKIMIGC